MNSKRISAALVIAVVIAIAVAGTQFNARGGGSSDYGHLEGSWEITVMPDGGGTIVDIGTFTPGGGIINSDPDPNLSTGHGDVG